MRFGKLWVLLTLLGGFGSAVAKGPAAIGRSELRCDEAGCSVGVCLARDLLKNPTRILETARFIPNIVDGRPRGFRIFRVQPGSIAQKLGMQNGDTIRSIN